MSTSDPKQVVAVHRCRLFDFMPNAIQCLASNNAVNDCKDVQLAVARKGGAIEIYILHIRGWFVKQVIAGCSDHSVECLLWTNGYGLISGSVQGCINIYDLNNNSIKISANSFGGAVWSIAVSDITNKIAAACEDGSIKIFSGSSQSLSFTRSMDKQEDRILSVDWHPDETRLVSGSVNAARIWSYKTGHAIMKISIGEEDTIVWTVAFLSNGMVATGDSHGMLQFWNSKHGSLVSSNQSHSSDILCMEVSRDERNIFVSGVDPKVVTFKYLENEEMKDNIVSGEWVKGEVMQRHTHDIRALAIAGNYLVSGGVDTNLQFKSVFNLKDRRNQKLKTVPQRNHLCYSEATRNLLMQYDNFVDIWHLPTTIKPMGDDGEILQIVQKPVRSAQIRLPNNESSDILSSAISKCGRWIACSTSNKLRLYKVIFEDVAPHKLSLDRFADNSKYLAALHMDGSIGVIALENEGAHLSDDFPCGESPRHILCVSPNSELIAVGGTDGSVEVFNVNKRHFQCALPRCETVVTAMTFKQNSTEIIFVTQDRKVSEFDVLSEKYTQWCRDNEIYLFPSSKRKRLLPPCVHAIQMSEHKTLFASYETVYVVDQARNEIKRLKQFEMVLAIIKMSSDSLLVVEQESSAITDKLPPALYHKKFGC